MIYYLIRIYPCWLSLTYNEQRYVQQSQDGVNTRNKEVHRERTSSRWVLTSMRFDYHKIWFTTEPEFWKKSRRQRQDNWLHKDNALTSGYDMTSWFLGERGDLEKHQESHEETSVQSQLLQKWSSKTRLLLSVSSTPQSHPNFSLFQARRLCKAKCKVHILTNYHEQTSLPSCQEYSFFLIMQKTSKLAFEACLTKLRLCTSAALLLNKSYKAISLHRNIPPLHIKCCVCTQELCKSHQN